MKAHKLEFWKDLGGGISWHARAVNGRIVTPSESYSRYRPARANALGTYPQANLPKVWRRGAFRLDLSLKTGKLVWS